MLIFRNPSGQMLVFNASFINFSECCLYLVAKKDEKIIRILPIAPTEIKTKSIINKEDIETKYGIVTYNPNKPNKKGND